MPQDDPYSGLPKTTGEGFSTSTFDDFTPTGERTLYGYESGSSTSHPDIDEVDSTASKPSGGYDYQKYRSDTLRDKAGDGEEATRSASSGDVFTLDGSDKGSQAAYQQSERTSRDRVSSGDMTTRQRDSAIKDVSSLDISESAFDSTFSDITGTGSEGAVGAGYAGSGAYTIGGLTSDSEFDPSIIAREVDVNKHCMYIGVSGSQAESASAMPYTFSETSSAISTVVSQLLDMREGIFAATDGKESNVVRDLSQAQKALTNALEYFASGSGIQNVARALEEVAQPANSAVMAINTEGVGYIREYDLAAPIIKKLHESGENPAGIPGIEPNTAVSELVVAALEAGASAGTNMSSVLSDAESVASQVVGVIDDSSVFQVDISDVETVTTSGTTTKAGPESTVSPHAPAAAPAASSPAPAAAASGPAAPVSSPGPVGSRRAGGGGGTTSPTRPGSRRGTGGDSSSTPGRAGASIKPNESGVVKPADATFTSGFGERWGSMHKGVDLANEIGTPIYAVMDGTVINAGPASGFGNWVRIQHGDGSISVYGHMQADMIYVAEGDEVQCGQNIAGIGSEGQSTGPHLHFEIYPEGGDAIDPQPWFAQYGITL